MIATNHKDKRIPSKVCLVIGLLHLFTDVYSLFDGLGLFDLGNVFGFMIAHYYTPSVCGGEKQYQAERL